MKQIFKIFMLLAIVASTFTACEKDEPVTPDRDKFIGTWSGAVTFKTTWPGGSETEVGQFVFKIEKVGDGNEVQFSFDEKATPVKATVTDKTMTINSGETFIFQGSEGAVTWKSDGYANITESGSLELRFDNETGSGATFQTLTITGQTIKLN